MNKKQKALTIISLIWLIGFAFAYCVADHDHKMPDGISEYRTGPDASDLGIFAVETFATGVVYFALFTMFKK